MFELYGGPVNVKQADLSRIDPTFDHVVNVRYVIRALVKEDVLLRLDPV